MTKTFRLGLLSSLAFALAACGAADSKTETSPKDSADTPKAAEKTEKKAKKDAKPAETITEADMVMGAADAPITVIEYASMTCPACANFHENVFPQIKEKFVDTGKVRFVFREFPTAPVDFSMIGSVLSRCVAEDTGSDGYFLMLSSLFKSQRAWIYGDDPKLELLKIAGQAGMDEATFDACLKERQDLVDLVKKNAEEAVDQFGVAATPTLILDGEKMSYRSAEDIEDQLAAAFAAATGEAAPGDDTNSDDTDSGDTGSGDTGSEDAGEDADGDEEAPSDG